MNSDNFKSLVLEPVLKMPFSETQRPLRVPDYQRAFSWEEKQISLFIGDLQKYIGKGSDYYFGHFIVEEMENGWELVDGQQRISTFVIFLMVCRKFLDGKLSGEVESLVQRFSTVSYDQENLRRIAANLDKLDELLADFPDRKKAIPARELVERFAFESGTVSRSLERIVSAMLQFVGAFKNGMGGLLQSEIPEYIEVILKSNCSIHVAKGENAKAVAIRIFEMHNTRGVPLTLIEIVKAKLMQFVYDQSSRDRDQNVKIIQQEFGEIYRMEEALAAETFRGDMTLAQLLRLHLRVVDDGKTQSEADFSKPASNASNEDTLTYLDERLATAGEDYAVNLAIEFRKSVSIVSDKLVEWDDEDDLVGDVLILERDISTQLFLVLFRRFGQEVESVITTQTLRNWERLLFTRDFHEGYYNLKGGRDNFPQLFFRVADKHNDVDQVIEAYLQNGFRTDRTSNLQSLVRKYVEDNESQILKNAFYWRSQKMKYGIYKFEKREKNDMASNIREIVKGTISVEHILPQNWHWILDEPEVMEPTRSTFIGKVDGFINGIGNLMLLNPSSNTSMGNMHPSKKSYVNISEGGSYSWHETMRPRWGDRDAEKWEKIVDARGREIYQFILSKLLAPEMGAETS